MFRWQSLFYYLLLSLLVILLIPIIAVVGFLLLVMHGKPIIYTQRRVGHHGKIFTIYKFRTMEINADELKNAIEHLNETAPPAFKIYNDPRFTRLGKFLSHTGLDEILQILNILKGDMSLIGPRPLPVEEARQLKPWHQQRHTIKPGIISPWVLQGYHATTFDTWMESDIRYAKHKSFRYDLQLSLLSLAFLSRLIVRELKRVFTVFSS